MNLNLQMDMKKILAILMMAVIAVGSVIEAGAVNRKVRSSEVVDLVKNYNHEDGFEVVSVGSLGMGLARMVARAAAETEEDKAALGVINNINKVVAVEYSDIAPAKKEAFNAKLSKLLDGAEKIIEVKDDGDTVNIYGTSADNGETIDDIIIFVPEECALVCLFGSVSSKNIAGLVEMSK